MAYELNLTLELTPEGKELFQGLNSIFPDACPECGWTHESHTFERRGDSMRCHRCNYALKARDLYPEIIA